MSYKLTSSKRNELIDEMVDRTIDSMDWDTLRQFAYEHLADYYKDLTDSDILDQYADATGEAFEAEDNAE